MKFNLFLGAVLLSASTLLLNAQPPRQHNRQGQGQGQGLGEQPEMITPEARADRMAQHLELTEIQKAKVLELFKNQESQLKAAREVMRAMRQKNEKPSEAQRAEYQAQRKANDAALEKIIGAEKFAKWEAERKGQLQKMNQKRKNRQGDEMGSTQARRHNPEQRAKMADKIKENVSPEKRAERLKAELQLSDTEKDALVQLFQSEKNKIAEERKQKMEAMQKSHEAEMEKIIGKDKMTKYKELQKNKQDKVKKYRKNKQA